MFLSIRNVFHCAVPIFFMISGALLLAPEKEMPIEKLLKKYIAKYASVIFIFCWGFALIEEIFTYKTIKVSMILTSFVKMLEGNSWNHMWYMYALLGTILLVPVLRVIVQNFSKNERYFIFAVCIIFISVLPMIKNLTGFSFGVGFPISTIYCVYMLIGYWIEQEIINLNNRIDMVGIVVSVLLIIAFSVIQANGIMKTEAFVSYSSPLILLYSVCLFSLAKKLRINHATSSIIKFLGAYSFGVYIVHMLWINLAYKLFKINPFQPNAVLGFMIMFLGVSVASIITTAIMKKIPLINKIV